MCTLEIWAICTWFASMLSQNMKFMLIDLKTDDAIYMQIVSYRWRDVIVTFTRTGEKASLSLSSRDEFLKLHRE